MKKLQFVVITQQIEGNPEVGYDAYFYSDLKLFDDRKRAIRHGFKTRGSDDFNVGTVQDGRLVAFGWMDWNFGDPGHESEDDPHGGYDLAAIEEQTCLHQAVRR